MPHPPIYYFFISHKKIEATACARYLKLLIHRYDSNLKVFYDSDDLIDLNKLYYYIDNSGIIIILLTDNYFNSFWCFFEFMVFTILNKPLVCFIFSENKTILTSINLKDIYNGFNEYQKNYISDNINKVSITKDVVIVMSEMQTKISLLISDSILIPPFTDVDTNINLFRDSALIKIDTIIKSAKTTSSDTTSFDITSSDTTSTKYNTCLSILKDNRYCENNIVSKFITVGYKNWEVVSIAKIIKHLCITDLRIDSYLLFDKNIGSITTNKCNTVIIVLLYGDCLMQSQFADNLLFIYEKDTGIIFQGIKVDTNFEYPEIDKIDEIVKKLYPTDIQKKTTIRNIYIMLIKQYISIPFDSYQSLDILKIQLLQIIKRLSHFLPNCQFSFEMSHI